MDKMKFMMFSWKQNPEVFGIRTVCQPEYVLNSEGCYEYQGLGPLCRVMTGQGTFTGPDAAQQYNALAVIMATRTPGELVHPTWGTMEAVLTELTMEQGSRPGHIQYSFTFQGTDATGAVPRLPEIE